MFSSSAHTQALTGQIHKDNKPMETYTSLDLQLQLDPLEKRMNFSTFPSCQSILE